MSQYNIDNIIIVTAQRWGRLGRFWNEKLPGGGALSRWLGEKFVGNYKQKMQVLRQVDDSIFNWTQDLDTIIKKIERAFSAKRIIDVAILFSEIDQNLKSIESETKKIEELYENDLEDFEDKYQEDIEKLRQYHGKTAGFWSDLGRKFVSKRMERIRTKERNKKIQELIDLTKGIISNVKNYVKQLGTYRKSGYIGEYLNVLKRIEVEQQKFQSKFVVIYDAYFKNSIEQIFKKQKEEQDRARAIEEAKRVQQENEQKKEQEKAQMEKAPVEPPDQLPKIKPQPFIPVKQPQPSLSEQQPESEVTNVNPEDEDVEITDESQPGVQPTITQTPFKKLRISTESMQLSKNKLLNLIKIAQLSPETYKSNENVKIYTPDDMIKWMSNLDEIVRQMELYFVQLKNQQDKVIIPIDVSPAAQTTKSLPQQNNPPASQLETIPYHSVDPETLKQKTKKMESDFPDIEYEELAPETSRSPLQQLQQNQKPVTITKIPEGYRFSMDMEFYNILKHAAKIKNKALMANMLLCYANIIDDIDKDKGLKLTAIAEGILISN